MTEPEIVFTESTTRGARRMRWFAAVAGITTIALGLGCDRPASDSTDSVAPNASSASSASTASVATPRSRPPNLLLVTLDTTRADALGSYGQWRPTSPRLDALAKKGVVFDQVSTTNPETLPSHATIFTGRWPFSHGVRANSGYVLSRENHTLAEILRDHGYRTGAEVAARVLRSETLITQGFDHDRGASSQDVSQKQVAFADEPGAKRTTHTRVADDISRRGVEFIRENKGRPFFLWLHYFDAHDPYSAPATFNATIPDSAYHAEVAYQDSGMGRVLEELDRLGLAQQTLVVVTADHGEDLGDHGEASHSYGIYESTMRVPLVLAGLPAIEPGQRIQWPVRTIDIAPTALDLLGLPVPSEMQGVSLRSTIEDPAVDPALPGYGESTRFASAFNLPIIRFLREGRWKYIHKANPELYDMLADPSENANVIEQNPKIAATLRAKLESLVESATRAPDDAESVVDARTAAELSVLGYMAHEAIEFSQDGESLEIWGADPNVVLPEAKIISETQGLLLRRDFEGGWKLLEPALSRYPDSLVMNDLAATLHFELGSPERSAEALRRILGVSSCDRKARMNLQSLLRKQGKIEEQAEVFATAVAACPDDAQLLNNFAWLLATSGEDSVRDGALAVELARRALDARKQRLPELLDTLACALAENGDFEAAVRIAEEALMLAQQARMPAQALRLFEGRVTAFRAGEPVREAQ